LSLLTPLTWHRNGDWANEVRLFESEYRRGNQKQVLRLLTGAYIQKGSPRRAAEICDTHTFEGDKRAKYANHCAIAYAQLRRNDDAERAYLAATRSKGAQSAMHANLAQFYLRQGRRQDAMQQFERAMEAENVPAMRTARRDAGLPYPQWAEADGGTRAVCRSRSPAAAATGGADMAGSARSAPRVPTLKPGGAGHRVLPEIPATTSRSMLMKELWSRWELPGYVAVALLMLATVVSYHNAWPDVLVHDDKFFAGSPRVGEWRDVPRFSP
jgi:hypothetical protein